MKKVALSIAVTAALGLSSSVSAAILSIDAGSNFGMEVAPGYVVPTQILGSLDTDAASLLSDGSHGGAPGTVAGENPLIDDPWLFFSNTGMHGSTGQVTLTADGANGATLDMSGWYVHWNGVQIDMSSGGTAAMTCSTVNCDGGTYTATYAAIVPDDGSTNFGNVAYTLNLQGTITPSAVPVPAAVWLFGSGLLGLVGVARRKKAA
jgi:hypothetical protein